MTPKRGYIEVDLGGALTSIECEGQFWTRRYPDLQAALTHADVIELLEGTQGTILGTAPVGISPRVFMITLPETLSGAVLSKNGFTVTPMRSGMTGIHLAAAC